MLVPFDGALMVSPCPALPSQAVFGLSPILMSLQFEFTIYNNGTQWDSVKGAWWVWAGPKPSRGVSCMVEGRRTRSAGGIGHWDGSYPQIAHGLHSPLEEGFRDAWKDSTTGHAAALLCSAFLEAGKCVLSWFSLLSTVIPANPPLIAYQTSNKMWLSDPRWRHGALLLSSKPSVKMA